MKDYLCMQQDMATFTTKDFSKHDDYMTPKSCWEDIKEYIPKDKLIWESFYGDGQSGKYLQELGFNVVHENIDFFQNDLGDIIITNPPFTKKKEVFTRLKELDKPFIVICPVSTMNTKYFRELFKNEIQVLVPPSRIQFQKLVNGVIPDKFEKRCNFDCFYYCYKMNLHKDIIFL